MVTNGHKWSQMVTWLQMVTNGHMFTNGHEWSQMVTNGHMFTNGHKWLQGYESACVSIWSTLLCDSICLSFLNPCLPLFPSLSLNRVCHSFLTHACFRFLWNSELTVAQQCNYMHFGVQVKKNTHQNACTLKGVCWANVLLGRAVLKERHCTSLESLHIVETTLGRHCIEDA